MKAVIQIRDYAGLAAGCTAEGLKPPGGQAPACNSEGHSMTVDHVPASNSFQAAIGRYSTAFPRQDLPFLKGVHRDDQPVAITLLDLAVAMGQPLPRWGVMHVLGVPEPMPRAAV